MRFLRRLLSSVAIGLALAGVLLGVRLVALPGSKAAPPGSEIRVIDGDTVEIGGHLVRLFGIDAPELGQRCLHDGVWSHCGLDAAFELKKLIGVTQTPVKCTPVASQGATSSAICMVGRTDIAHALLIGGYVTATAGASPEYKEAEAEASRAGLGLWHSQFVDPVDWRAGERLPDQSGADSDSCPIKATITADDQRIFYVPTDPGYQAVEIDPATAGRLFCSVDVARAAGWRHAGGTDDALQ